MRDVVASPGGHRSNDLPELELIAYVLRTLELVRVEYGEGRANGPRVGCLVGNSSGLRAADLIRMY